MTQNTGTLRGPALARVVMNHIIAHPETWDQTAWHCGTAHCFGGWCQVMGGLEEDDDGALADMERLLGVSHADALWLCYRRRTRYELYAFVKALVSGEDCYDRNGFCRVLYERDDYYGVLYDLDGYDRDGYDRDGRQLELKPL